MEYKINPHILCFNFFHTGSQFTPLFISCWETGVRRVWDRNLNILKVRAVPVVSKSWTGSLPVLQEGDSPQGHEDTQKHCSSIIKQDACLKGDRQVDRETDTWSESQVGEQRDRQVDRDSGRWRQVPCMWHRCWNSSSRSRCYRWDTWWSRFHCHTPPSYIKGEI